LAYGPHSGRVGIDNALAKHQPAVEVNFNGPSRHPIEQQIVPAQAIAEAQAQAQPTDAFAQGRR